MCGLGSEEGLIYLSILLRTTIYYFFGTVRCASLCATSNWMSNSAVSQYQQQQVLPRSWMIHSYKGDTFHTKRFAIKALVMDCATCHDSYCPHDSLQNEPQSEVFEGFP